MQRWDVNIWKRAMLIAVTLGCFTIGGIVVAAEGVKATGTLSEVRENGTVVIDDQGYELSPSVVIVDGQGKRISLNDLKLPAVVKYEYKYQADRGPVIRVIRELPQ